MKKLISIFFLILAVLYGFGQGATPSSQIRVANATIAFGINIPIGTTVYDISADKYFVCKTASIATLTLTTGSANFTQVGGAGLGGTVTSVSTGANYLKVVTGTTTPLLQAQVGIAKDSLVKMDSLATAGQWAKFGTKGLVGRSSASVLSEIGGKTYKAFEAEAAVDSLTRYIYALSVTPVSTSVQVAVNGVNLKATTQYTIVATKIYITAPIRTYDRINISCTY